MPTNSCPFLNPLAKKLVDAYRRREDAAGTVSSIKVEEEITEIHRAIRLHRDECSICANLLARGESPKAGWPLKSQHG
jgi:hypothetical protein